MLGCGGTWRHGRQEAKQLFDKWAKMMAERAAASDELDKAMADAIAKRDSAPESPNEVACTDACMNACTQARSIHACMQARHASDAKSTQMHLALGTDCHRNDSSQCLIKSCCCCCFLELVVAHPGASKCQELARCSSCQGPGLT